MDILIGILWGMFIFLCGFGAFHFVYYLWVVVRPKIIDWINKLMNIP